jgi:hypothetical protein
MSARSATEFQFQQHFVHPRQPKQPSTARGDCAVQSEFTSIGISPCLRNISCSIFTTIISTVFATLVNWADLASSKLQTMCVSDVVVIIDMTLS